jgi:hypothetical protein
MGNSLFYKELGKLLYAIAAADNTITTAERKSLGKEITERLLHKERSTDRYGTSKAWDTQFSFETSEDQGVTADDAFDAIVKANTAKNRKKSAGDIYLILTEPDLYLTVTPSTSKYLLASVVRRVDRAVFDVISAAVNNGIIADKLDSDLGIYGRRYTISNQGVEIVLKSKVLGTQAAAINAAAVAAYAR